LKTLISILTIIISIVIFSNYSYAVEQTTTQISAEELLKDPNISSEVRESIVKAINSKQPNTVINIERAYEWKDFVKVFAEAIKDVCHTLNVEVNEIDANKAISYEPYINFAEQARTDKEIKSIIFIVSSIICFFACIITIGTIG